MDKQTKVAGVILAGGLARRMDNQDKGLLSLHGKPLISYAVAALSQVVGKQLVINANRNLAQYAQWGFPVVQDLTQTFDGPLAGVLAALDRIDVDILLVMPCDSPCIQACHLQALANACLVENVAIAVADDGQRLHPVFMALKTDLKANLQTYLENGHRKLQHWIDQHAYVRVDFSAEPDVFENINTHADLEAIQLKLGAP